MDYPDNCIKGIPNNEHMTAEGSLATHLFYFTDTDRGDGWKDQSINWEDDDSAISFTLKQTREGNLQFRAGVAILPRSAIDRLNEQPTVQNRLSYERDKLSENVYHGNILLTAETSKPLMRQIAAGLALAVSNILPPYSNQD